GAAGFINKGCSFGQQQIRGVFVGAAEAGNQRKGVFVWCCRGGQPRRGVFVGAAEAGSQRRGVFVWGCRDSSHVGECLFGLPRQAAT
nr:hypothetical protein [Tanacetum cinerariifolium]